MLRQWGTIKQIAKDLYWAIIALIALFILLMAARQIYYRAYRMDSAPVINTIDMIEMERNNEYIRRAS